MDHSYIERENPLLSLRGSFICTIPQVAHTTAFVIPILDQWLELEIAQWVHHEESI